MAEERIRAGRSGFAIARLVAGLLGLALAGASLPGLTSGPAGAAPVTDGSDWGSSGQVSSDSAVTVRWDNADNPDSSVVPRNGRQTLPHTAGKTYDDVAASVSDPYAQYFGKDNGLGGLTVRVSQTRQLVNQSVGITISGSAGGAAPGVPQSAAYFQVMQCWGGLTGSGTPDVGAEQPDPATCQVGAVGPDSAGGGEKGEQRYLGTDPLALGGDWKDYYGGLAPDVPFTAVNGEQAASLVKNQNSFFNQTTTNELSDVTVDSSGNAARTFEVQTSVESAGLGCGKRADAPSTSTCWLVVVPRIFNLMRNSGAIAPSLWAQRLQVKLTFRDISLGCPGGAARTLVGGSELLGEAAGSWTPGVCSAKKIALGYTKLGDQIARSQFASGAQGGIATSQPVMAAAGAVAVPTAVAAPVFAFNLTYQPTCLATDASTEEQAKSPSCGYGSLAEMRADTKRAGTPVRDLKLDARLVAKLLTQSYVGTYMVAFDKPAAPWMTRNGRPAGILHDPEFLRLNPDLVHVKTGPGAATDIDHLITEGLRSDSASAVWQWILADPIARSFLNGCPDRDGMTINPFFSTRTYVGCEDRKKVLSAQAEADRAQTDKAASYADLAITYPPDGSPFPLPTWQQYDAAGRYPQTVIDKLPPVDNMAVAARDVAIGYVPQNSVWCATELDTSCQPPPGKWKDPKARQRSAALGVIAITDSATSARFQLPTAQLCDSDGDHCVAATSGSLQKAADRFVATEVQGFAGPGDADYASGAYPLTMPVYAAISTALPLADRVAYADALTFITTTGQTPGFAPGTLPPGYAPLTASLRADASAAIARLRTADPSATQTGPGDGTDASPSATANASTGTAPVLSGPTAPPPPGAGAPSTAPTGTTPQAAAQFDNVAAGQESWPWFTLPFGLGVAVLAGLAGPLLRMGSRLKVG